MMPDTPMVNESVAVNTRNSALTRQKWGGFASFLLALAFIVAPWIYLVGNLRDALGPFSYALADLLYGPVWAASLVTVFFVLREHIAERAPRRMTLALLAALLAAAAMIFIACIRSANRQYHLHHPELQLENSTTVLVVWTTLVAGLTGAAWHFLGWALVLLGSVGWSSIRFPRGLSILSMLAGAISLFVYQFPNLEPTAGALAFFWAIWQGIFLLRAGTRVSPLTEQTSNLLG